MQTTIARVMACSFALLLSQAATTVRAQDEPTLDAAELHRRAMDAYQAFDFDAAVDMLQHALTLSSEHAERASLHLALAVVYANGKQDTPRALDAMQAALCEDASAELDPLLASPDASVLLLQARERAARDGCSASAPSTSELDSERPPILTHAAARVDARETRETDEPDPATAPRMFIRAGAAVSFSWVSNGMAADRSEDPPLGDARLRTRTDGFVPGVATRFAVGAQLADRFVLSGIMRFQLEAGVGALAGVLLGGRLAWSALGPASAPLSLWLFTGGSVGRIDARPAQSRAYAISGLAGAHVGVELRAAVSRKLSFVLGPEIDLQLPTAMWNTDVTLATELRFW